MCGTATQFVLLATGEWALRHIVLIVVSAIGFLCQGCSLAQTYFGDLVKDGREGDASRIIEIEIDHPGQDLPCNVIYRPTSGKKEVLWRARFEKGFCHRKANEARLLLESRGWTCRSEHPDDGAESNRSDFARNIVMAWRCEQDLTATVVEHDPLPPVPVARPEGVPSRSDKLGDPALRAAVEGDLATIGRSIADPSTTSFAAQGDLDNDGIDDAIVVLTHKLDPQRWDRMVMAYLRSDETYYLVDAQISSVGQAPRTDELVIDIDNGVVRLQSCCSDAVEPTTIVLHNRKLTRSDGIGHPLK